ncbi:MAG: hypothetical protein WCK11_03250 [Candidatus Falkowbacteria bacterium]
MNFDQALKNINRSLSKKQPITFDDVWIKHRLKVSYKFIKENIITELGGIDWDAVVCRLDYKHQKLWYKGVKIKQGIELYNNNAEVEIALSRYREKLYTFLVQINKEDKIICNLICIKLVRVAQKGNLLAKQRLISLLTGLTNQWIDNQKLKNWRGYNDKIEQNIERCIRRYRYSGSFYVYLFRTLEYAGRGLRPLESFSLDDFNPVTEKRRSDNLVYDDDYGGAKLIN